MPFNPIAFLNKGSSNTVSPNDQTLKRIAEVIYLWIKQHPVDFISDGDIDVYLVESLKKFVTKDVKAFNPKFSGDLSRLIEDKVCDQL